jgi:hypothetical protein
MNQRIKSFIKENIDDYINRLGDVDLTMLEEDIQIEFNISEDDFEDNDLSYAIWQYCNVLGVLEDTPYQLDYVL